MEYEKIESIDALKERMEKHNEETICLYKSAVALGAQNEQIRINIKMLHYKER